MAMLGWGLVVALVAMTVIPVSRVPHGLIRSFSFARQQILVLALALMPVTGWLVGAGWVAAGALGAVALWQLAYVVRFMPIGRVQSLPAEATLAGDGERQIAILTANVRQSNRAHGRLVDLIRAERPDLVIALEVDAGWAAALEALAPEYPVREVRAQENGYGMAILSRRRLEAVEWRELLVEGVPSARVTLRVAGEAVRLYALHPEPPVPWRDTEGRDAEIGLVGMEAARDALPAIVAGDLNDVAWSHTTRRFQRLSGLLDPRVGRGFYNTFHAQVPIWRWPLDHLFHSGRFRLVEMRRLPDIGSDHFPMLFRLALAARPAKEEAPGDPRAEDQREVHEMAAREAARERPPIGEDWEG